MGYRTRRRIDLVLLVVAGAALAGVAALAAAAGDGERITRYWVSARIDDDAARIVEVIDYDFGSQRRHGIFRDIDDLGPDPDIAVSSPTAPDQFVVTEFGQRTNIRIGDPDRTISGRHRYRVEYRLDIDGGGRILAWDAVGTGWQVGLSDIEVHVTGPREFGELRCSTGVAGTWGGCTVTQPEPGHLMVRLDGLDAGEGVTIGATPQGSLAAAPPAPPPPDGPAPDPGVGILRPAAVALVLSVLAAGVVSRRVRRAGRELVWAGGAADAAYGPQLGHDLPVRLVDHEELGQLASTEFTPPRGLAAWQGGILHAEGVSSDHKVAWLLEQAIDGHIQIDGDDPPTLVQVSTAPDQDDADALHAVFGGRSSVTLGQYDKQFAAGWKQVENRLDRWQERAPFWDPAGETRRGRALGVGVVTVVAGLVLTGVTAALANRSGSAWLVGLAVAAPLAGAGWALLLRAWELRVRTPEGSGLWILTESFRRFVEGSEARHVEEAARVGRLREYTAWATALGQADHWAEVVGDADLDPAVEPTGLYLAALAPSLSSATSSAATAPSSGGGGGGGGVGGGAGGGGGGSW